MLSVRRVLALSAFLALIVISSPLMGDSGSATDSKRSPLKGDAVHHDAGQLVEKALAKAIVSDASLTYQSAQGDTLFALKVKPALTGQNDLPKDYVILVDSTASQAGAPFIVQRQMAAQWIKQLGPKDRVALWEVNVKPRALTSGWASANDPQLSKALAKLDQTTPMGAADFKSALSQAVSSFEATTQRQQVVIYLGDGQGTLNPFTPQERRQVVQTMTQRRIQFFAVPLGAKVDLLDISALATGTGGVILRINLTEAADVAVTRCLATVRQPVLYVDKVAADANVAESYPTQWPPLRSDVPTLVAGKLAKSAPQLSYQVEGQLLGRAASITVSSPVAEPMMECFFLANVVKQWRTAADQPALMQADYALAFSFNQTSSAKEEIILQGRQALEFEKLDVAKQLFEQIADLDPNDAEAQMGLKLVAHLDKEKSKGRFKQTDDNLKKEDDLLRRTQQRQDLEKQRLKLLMDDTIRQSRKELAANPDEAVRRLKLLSEEVRNDPNLGDELRNQMRRELESELRTAQDRAEKFLAQQQDREQRLAQAKAILDAQNARADQQARLRAALQQFEGLVQQARLEEAMLQAQTAFQLAPESIVTNVAVQQSELGYNLDANLKLQQDKRVAYMETMYELEVSHRPIPDNPPMAFPPPGDPFFKTKTYTTWGQLSDKRKKRWGNTRFNEPNAAQSEEIQRKLNQATDKFRSGLDAMPLEEQLAFIGKVFGVQFIIDERSFKAVDPNVEIAKKEVSLRQMTNVSVNTVLNSILAQLEPTATYVIRGDHVEITTLERVLKDPGKPIVAYPILELIYMGGVASMMQGGMGGGMMGMMGMGGGMMGMGGGMMGMGGGMMGMGGGGMMGMMGMGGGMMGMGGGMMGMGGGMMGMGGGMMGMGGGMMGMGGMGGMMGMGGGMMGMMGMGGGMMGMMGMGGGGMPPAMSFYPFRIMNANSLMNLIKQVVDPGKDMTWHIVAEDPGQLSGGGGGLGGGPGGGTDTDAPPVSPDTAHTMQYYDPVFALIVKAPSQRNPRASTLSSSDGGFARIKDKDEQRVVAGKGDEKSAPKTGSGSDNKGDQAVASNKPKIDVDPKQAWEAALAKSNIHAGFVIATVDFLTQNKQYDHAAEFLKAVFRKGVDLRPWMFDALALNLELSQGDPVEVERALLSAADLIPEGGMGYLTAAKAMARHRHWQRALEFCQQAAARTPGDPTSYVFALEYATEAKDAKALSWAAKALLSRDWPMSLDLHALALSKLDEMSAWLAKEGRTQDAERLHLTRGTTKQRDLIVRLTWQGDADLDLHVKEPVGTSCSFLHRESPAGGVLQSDLSATKRTQVYSVAEGFSGAYQLTVRRAWGRPMGNKAVLEIITRAGTGDETIRRETLTVDQDSTFTVQLDHGRRTKLSDVAAPDVYRRLAAELRPAPESAQEQLSALAVPVVRGTTGYLQANMLDEENPLFKAMRSRGAISSGTYQTTVMPSTGTVGFAAQAKPTLDGKATKVTLQPIFLGGSTTLPINPVIPSNN